MAGKIKRRYVSGAVNTSNPNEIGSTRWNDSDVVEEGQSGDLFVRDATQTDGWQLVPPYATDVRLHASVLNDGTSATGTTNGIQAILTAHPSVVFTAGTYLLDLPLSVPSNRHLTILPGAVLKAANHRTGSGGTWTDTALLDVRDATNVTIDGGGTIDGDKDTLETRRTFGISVYDSTRVRIKDLTIINHAGNGTTGVNGGDGIIVSGDNAGTGSVDVCIEGCTLDGNVRQGISLVTGRHIRIAGCTIAHTSGSAPGGGIDIEPNVSTDTVEDVTILGCTFEDNHQHIIIASAGTTTDKNITISGCTFKSARAGGQAGGIRISRPGVTVSACTIQTNAGNGIAIMGTAAHGAKVSGCTFHGTADVDERAMVLITGSRGHAITGNVFRTTHQEAIRLDSNVLTNGDIRDVLIADNACIDCVTAGQTTAVMSLISGSGSARFIVAVTLTDNVISDVRTGGDEANTGILLSNITSAERATLDIGPNTITGVADPFAGPTGMVTTGPTLHASATLNFGSLTGPDTADLTIAVPGAGELDLVTGLSMSHASVGADTTYDAWVSAADTVTVRCQVLAGTVDNASGTFTVAVTKRYG
jgi:hypothetical protein